MHKKLLFLEKLTGELDITHLHPYEIIHFLFKEDVIEVVYSFIVKFDRYIKLRDGDLYQDIYNGHICNLKDFYSDICASRKGEIRHFYFKK